MSLVIGDPLACFRMDELAGSSRFRYLCGGDFVLSFVVIDKKRMSIEKR